MAPARWLSWKESVLEMPVVRRCGTNKMVSETKGMDYITFLSAYTYLLQRSGYLEMATPWGIRRGSANTLCGKVPDADLRRILGHVRASTYEKNYLAKTLFADSQLIIQGNAQRQDLTSQFQRMGNLRDERAPLKLPPGELLKIEDDEELVEHQEKRISYRVCVAQLPKRS